VCVWYFVREGPGRSIFFNDQLSEISSLRVVCLLLQYWGGVFTRYHSNRGVSFSFRRVPQIWRSQSGL
jgi:hypothetical protein